MKRQNLKILLLQFRDDQYTADEELNEFALHSQLDTNQFVLLNTVYKQDFNDNVIDGFDALFVGGSSYVSVLNPEHMELIKSSQALLQRCYDNNIPVFASCFGFQLAAEQFGGGVIHDKENMEMGILPIELSDACKDDLIMHDFPNPFLAVSAHQERANILPKNAITLCYTDLCPFHAFKLVDKPFYAFQFHPEISRDVFIQRITRYKDRYFDDNDYFREKMKKVKDDTPFSNQLVRKFVDRILLG